MDVSQFIINVVASMLGGLTLVLLVGFFSKKAKWILTGILSLLTKSDLEFVYANREDIKEDMRKDIRRSSQVLLFTSRGFELQRESFYPMFHKKDADKSIDIKILLPDFNCTKDSIDWLMEREKERASFDKAFGNGVLHTQVKSNVEFLKQYIKLGDVELKLYNQPHIGRILITDKFGYFTPYNANEHGSESNLYKYRRGGAMYDNLKRQFNLYWESAREPFPSLDVQAENKEVQ